MNHLMVELETIIVLAIMISIMEKKIVWVTSNGWMSIQW